MQRNEQKELKIPGAQLHMVNNNCTNFQINPCNSFWETVQTKPQNENEKTPVKFKIIIQSRWKISGAQLHMVNNMCTNFQTNPSNSFWVMVRTKSRLQTDGQTDMVIPIYPPLNFVCGGYNKIMLSSKN